MAVVPLISAKVARILDEKVDSSDTTETASLAKVFTGADQTAKTPSKIGDIFITNAGGVYIAVGVDPSTGWQLVPQT